MVSQRLTSCPGEAGSEPRHRGGPGDRSDGPDGGAPEPRRARRAGRTGRRSAGTYASAAHHRSIDGTRNFVRGIPVFATLLAIEAGGEVVAGVASAPALGARWHAARGSGAFRDGQRMMVSRIASLERATLFHGNLGSGEGGPPPGIAGLIARIERTRGFGDFYQHMLVAEGAGEIAFDPVMQPWDIAALQVIVEEAGGHATSLGGERSIYTGSLVTSNGPLHESALRALAQEKGVS